MCFIVINVKKLFTLKSAWNIKIKMHNIDQNWKTGDWSQVIKIKTMILCICITLLIVTFSVIIVSNYQIVI